MPLLSVIEDVKRICEDESFENLDAKNEGKTSPNEEKKTKKTKRSMSMSFAHTKKSLTKKYTKPIKNTVDNPVNSKGLFRYSSTIFYQLFVFYKYSLIVFYRCLLKNIISFICKC